jgi:hypothetical protein
MPAQYLDWLADIFEEAQVPYTPESAAWLDLSLRKLVNAPAEDEDEVYRRIREKWLRHGPPGRQLLAAFLRDEVFVRRDSPLRPKEGSAYYTNDYKPKAVPPHPHGR